MPDDETTFAQLQERIAKTLAVVKAADRSESIDGKEDAEIVLTFPNGEFRFTGHSRSSPPSSCPISIST